MQGCHAEPDDVIGRENHDIAGTYLWNVAMPDLVLKLIDPRRDDAWRDPLRQHLLRLDRASLRQRFMTPSDATTVDAYLAEIQPEMILFLEDAGRVVACAEVHPVPGASHHEVAVSVEPRYQSRGLGKRLVHAAAAECQRRGLTELHVYCDHENTRMQKIARSFKSRSRPIANWAMAAFSVKLGGNAGAHPA